MSPFLIFYTKPASGSSIKLSKVLPAHIPADIFTLRSCCLPGFPPEVRFIGFSDLRKLSGVLLSSYNTWPWRSVVWGWPFSQFLHHSSLLPTRCKSHMLTPPHTYTFTLISAQKSLHNLRDGRGCSHSLHNLQTFSMTSGFNSPFWNSKARKKVLCSLSAVSSLPWTQQFRA